MNILLIISCICLLGTSVFFRKLAIDRLHPYQFQYIVGFYYLALMPVWYWIISSKTSSNLYWDKIGILFVGLYAVTNIIGSVSFGFLLKDTNNIGAISALISLNPIITLFLSFLFLNEQLTIYKIMAFILALISAILINY